MRMFIMNHFLLMIHFIFLRFLKSFKKLITQFINLSDERIEIIVIDDGSTDNTPKLKEEFKFKNFNYFKIKNSERGFGKMFYEIKRFKILL